jgi:hypothetical protein
MTTSLLHSFNDIIQSLSLLILIINALLHVIFAGAVAKDAGYIAKSGFPTQIVSPMTWAFAVLIGGVFVAAVYWLIHHAKFIRK